MKKSVFAVLCLCIAAALLGGCSYDREAAKQPVSEGQAVGMPNPFIDCQTMEKAEEIAGFNMSSPVFDDLTERSYQAVKGQMIQVFNRGDGAPGDGGVLVRKAKGSGDISGDYNTYPVNDTFEINGMKITARGTEEGYVTVIWEDGGYAYAMDMDEICMPKELLEVYIPMIR